LSSEDIVVYTLELALEEARELLIAGGHLAIEDGQAVRCIAGLLTEDLSQADHVGIVIELLREVDHIVRCILLSTRRRCSKKSGECGDGEWVAALTSSSGEASLFPFLGTFWDILRNPLVKRDGNTRNRGKGSECKGGVYSEHV
jgi:hypothetical protein